MKLPKQWLHWAKKAGLRRFTRRGSRQDNGMYMWGHRREWRVNRYGEFQCSDTYDIMDRWANSLHKTEPLPGTEREFLEAVRRMKE